MERLKWAQAQSAFQTLRVESCQRAAFTNLEYLVAALGCDRMYEPNFLDAMTASAADRGYYENCEPPSE